MLLEMHQAHDFKADSSRREHECIDMKLTLDTFSSCSGGRDCRMHARMFSGKAKMSNAGSATCALRGAWPSVNLLPPECLPARKKRLPIRWSPSILKLH